MVLQQLNSYKLAQDLTVFNCAILLKSTSEVIQS